MTMLMTLGIVSSIVRSGTEMWWNKAPSDYGDYPQIARIVNRMEQPILFCYGEWRLTQMICHRLDNSARLQLLADDVVPELSTEIGEAYLFNAPESARTNLEQGGNVIVEKTCGQLWKVVQQ